VRLLEPDAGRLYFDGTDVRGLDGAGRLNFSRQVQMVFQDPQGSLNPRAISASASASRVRWRSNHR